MNIIKEFVDFVSDIETPASKEYVMSFVGLILVAAFFIAFINLINYLWSIGLRILFSYLVL